MKKKKLLRLFGVICLVLILVALLLPACAKPAPAPAPKPAPTPTPTPSKPINLVYHFNMVLGTNCAIDAWWMDEVERLASGRVTFERIYGGSLGGAANQPMNIKGRVFDLGIITSVYNPGEYPAFTVTTLPFLTDSLRADSKANYDFLQSSWVQADFTAMNQKGLLAWTLEPMELLSHKRATSLEELKGLKIRGHGGGADALTAAGLISVAVPWAELATAGERRVVDAACVPVPITSRDSGFQDIWKYALRVPIYWFQFALAMNLDTWNSLPADIQKLMLDVAKGSPEKHIEIYETAMAGAWADFKKAGVEEVSWSKEELKKFEELAGPPVQKKWVEDMKAKGLPSQEILDYWKALLKKYGG